MKKWRYELKCANELREATYNDDIAGTIKAIYKAYEELRDNKLLDDDDFERLTQDFELYEDLEEDDDAEGTVNYELCELYDLCDCIRVWIPV